jgi:hypothetical protein
MPFLVFIYNVQFRELIRIHTIIGPLKIRKLYDPLAQQGLEAINSQSAIPPCMAIKGLIIIIKTLFNEGTDLVIPIFHEALKGSLTKFLIKTMTFLTNISF